MSKEQDLKDDMKPVYAVKESRADFTYYPKVKELKDSMCMPKTPEEMKLMVKILDNYI